MDLLEALIVLSEKAARVARLIRKDEHLFKLLVEQKKPDEANPRFVDDFKTLADVLIQQMIKHFLEIQVSKKRPVNFTLYTAFHKNNATCIDFFYQLDSSIFYKNIWTVLY